MKLSEKTFQVLDTLDRQEISTQRQLADHSGISLGQVNYILKSLLEKGLVKIDNFRKNPNKIGYAYLLTPKGIEAKSRLSVRFVIRKIREYDDIRERLTERLISIEKGGLNRIIFLGPPVVKDFINSLIKDKNLNIVLTRYYTNWKDVGNLDPETFDVALLFDGEQDDILGLGEVPQILKNKILPLW